MSDPGKVYEFKSDSDDQIDKNESRFNGIKTYSRHSLKRNQQQTTTKPEFTKPRNQYSKQTTLFVYNSITFTQHDYLFLRSPRYLNDTIISFFMQYYLDNNVKEDIKRKIHVFNSFFFAKIKSIREKQNQSDHDNLVSFNRVSRWLKGVKIFNKEFLIMPVCERDHWVLVIVCYPNKLPSDKVAKIPDAELYEPAVIVLNSWKTSTPPIKRILSQFLSFQWKIEKKEHRNFRICNNLCPAIKLLFPILPQQRNNYNCGVYMLNYFNCFLKDPRGNYIKMYRNRDLTRWFDNNSINIYTERTNMRKLVDELSEEWQIKQLDSGNVEQETTISDDKKIPKISTSTSKGGDNEVYMITDDNNDKKKDNNNDSIVVINIS